MRKLFIFILLSYFTLCYSQVTHCTVTCYQPVRKQCNAQPLKTADGSDVNLKHIKSGQHKWCAISRDLLYLFRESSAENILNKEHPKKILIEGFGVYEVRDLMNKRFHHRVDILVHPKDSKRIYINKVKITIIK